MTDIDWTALRETTRDDLLAQLRAVHPGIECQRNMWERGWTFIADGVSVNLSDAEAEEKGALKTVLGRIEQGRAQRDVLVKAVGGGA